MASGGGLTGDPSTSIFGGGGYMYDENGVPVHQDVYGPVPEGALRSELPTAEEYRRKKLREALEALASSQGESDGAYQPSNLLGPSPGIDMAPVPALLEAQYSELPTPILMQILFGQKE